MTEKSTHRPGRPPIPESARKTKNRFTFSISDDELSLLEVDPSEFSKYLKAVIVSKTAEKRGE